MCKHFPVLGAMIMDMLTCQTVSRLSHSRSITLNPQAVNPEFSNHMHVCLHVCMHVYIMHIHMHIHINIEKINIYINM